MNKREKRVYIRGCSISESCARDSGVSGSTAGAEVAGSASCRTGTRRSCSDGCVGSIPTNENCSNSEVRRPLFSCDLRSATDVCSAGGAAVGSFGSMNDTCASIDGCTPHSLRVKLSARLK